MFQFLKNYSYETALMNAIDAIIVLCTIDNEDSAKSLASKVIGKHLAVCVTIIPNVTSIYCWNSKVEQKSEVQMLIKTNFTCKNELINYIKINHPYQIPELLVLSVVDGDSDYLFWLDNFLN